MIKRKENFVRKQISNRHGLQFFGRDQIINAVSDLSRFIKSPVVHYPQIMGLYFSRAIEGGLGVRVQARGRGGVRVEFKRFELNLGFGDLGLGIPPKKTG